MPLLREELAKSGGCKSGDTCRFFHEPALAITVTPGGIEFAARRRGDPAVSEERRRDESDGGLYTRAEFVAEYDGTAEFDCRVGARGVGAGASRGGRHREAAAALRRRALLKLRHEGFAVVSASKGYEVYACLTAGFWPRRRPATHQALRQGDLVEGEMVPSNGGARSSNARGYTKTNGGEGRCPWRATSISAAYSTLAGRSWRAPTLAGQELGAPPSDGPLALAVTGGHAGPAAPARQRAQRRGSGRRTRHTPGAPQAGAGAELRGTGVAPSRGDKVRFLVADLQLDPALPWLEVIRAAEERTGLHCEGKLGDQIDFLYGELAFYFRR